MKSITLNHNTPILSLEQRANKYSRHWHLFDINATEICFSVDSEQCKEPLLPEKQNSHKMTPIDGRSQTTSESKDTNTNGQATTANSTISGHNTEDCFEVTIFDEGTDSGRLPDVVAESKIYGAADENEPLESYLAITIQVFIPFLIAGLGMVGAGLVLDLVQVRTEFTYLSCGFFFSSFLLSPLYQKIFYETRC